MGLYICLVLGRNKQCTHFQSRMEDHKAKLAASWWLLILDDRKDGKRKTYSSLKSFYSTFFSYYISFQEIFEQHYCYLLLLEQISLKWCNLLFISQLLRLEPRIHLHQAKMKESEGKVSSGQVSFEGSRKKSNFLPFSSSLKLLIFPGLWICSAHLKSLHSSMSTKAHYSLRYYTPLYIIYIIYYTVQDITYLVSRDQDLHFEENP